ncbi:hypothetical protein TVAG_130300 [Trichomonas vaginalis G3]|uniref:Uncharacterized protein n=1 Tax=Trichomonas vaginalis (strain ATCC PRA-98 / G3) TaxID=412133 RepID=A2DIC6_TRIV3|nr:hypothetical protein TVAGG3_0711630 [Trichomonas vaginalis G3]EAY19922.1 hypothetical protein TVAG_130300 [Trichomonas vaginalis G3]KAI5509943.1 hypothetical protein TVAGG3_0711630 [Trichomonas vaginalis G3]|eukprot:XP_001580908.1 hypothetical protein [Trichomonas vaginalis G3]
MSGVAIYISNSDISLFVSTTSFSNCRTTDSNTNGIVYTECQSVIIDASCTRSCFTAGKGSFLYSRFNNEKGNVSITEASTFWDESSSSSYYIFNADYLDVTKINSTSCKTVDNSLIYAEDTTKVNFNQSYIFNQNCNSVLNSNKNTVFSLKTVAFNTIKSPVIADGCAAFTFTRCAFFKVFSNISNILEPKTIVEKCYIDLNIKAGAAQIDFPSALNKATVFGDEYIEIGVCYTGPTPIRTPQKTVPVRTMPNIEPEPQIVAKPAVRTGIISVGLVIPLVMIIAVVIALVIFRARNTIDVVIRNNFQ